MSDANIYVKTKQVSVCGHAFTIRKLKLGAGIDAVKRISKILTPEMLDGFGIDTETGKLQIGDGIREVVSTMPDLAMLLLEHGVVEPAGIDWTQADWDIAAGLVIELMALNAHQEVIRPLTERFQTAFPTPPRTVE